MNDAHHHHARPERPADCPPSGVEAVAPAYPFSPLGWSAWRRLAVAGVACLALWAVVLWALD